MEPILQPKLRPAQYRTIILLLLLAAAIGASLFLGRYPEPGFLPLEQLFNDPLAQSLVINLRLPRILMAALLGMSLSGAGLVFQTIFSNPIVEPGFLGVSTGAAFGAALAIVIIGNQLMLVQGFAVVFGLAGLALSFIIASAMKARSWIIRLVLAGIMVSAFFSAGIGALKYIADPLRELPEITFWLLGGVWSTDWHQLVWVLLPVLLSLAIMVAFRWRLNVLSLDDHIAFASGSNVRVERTLILVSAVVGVAAVISVCGIVNWIGLLIPHLSRRFFNSDTRNSLPGAILMGAIFTVVCDTFARVASPGEIPLGILTGFFGSIIFILLLVNKSSPIQGE